MEYGEATCLERMRCMHEERQRLLQAMAEESFGSKSTKREQVNSDHRIRKLLDRYTATSKLLYSLYTDKNTVLQSEQISRSGKDHYDRFKQHANKIREYYTQHNEPSQTTYKPMSEEFTAIANSREFLAKEKPVEFRGEEGYARYLDLTGQHLKYGNLPGVKNVSYIRYLDIFDRLYELPLSTKQHRKYREYVNDLLNYLLDYLKRAKPLLDVENSEIPQIEEYFETQWSSNSFTGWSDSFLIQYCLDGKQEERLNLNLYDTVEQLKEIGNDRLKHALETLGLKCGGSVDEKAQRLFLTKGKSIDELDSSFFPKKNTSHKSITKENLSAIKESLKEVAFIEAQVFKFVEMLSSERMDTKNNVIRKQSLTVEERINEFGRNEDEYSDNEVSVEEDDETQVPADGTIYNPKNLPLGWDGKPIPYWLYKLHGLNLKFSCEICGNHLYLGPKAFIRHFSEWRHSHGMKCLGIPNTTHFSFVTLIEDAITIWEKMCGERENAVWKGDNEEFEDINSNVITRKMYNDLYRQGIF